ncbi:MAG: hypothetical protein QM709_05385 [Spongiibacteraceae bacterium]
MQNKNLITGVAVVVFIIAAVAAGRYAAQPRVEITSPVAQALAPTALSVPQSASPQMSPVQGKVDAVDVMVERLRTRLEREPNDVDGWVLLGRSYHYLERWEDAKAAFAKARELGYKGDGDMPTSSITDDQSGGRDAGNAEPVFHDIGRVGSDKGSSTQTGIAP